MEIHWSIATDPIEIDRNELHVWLVNLEDSSRTEATLSNDERERLEHLRTDDLRRRFIAARTGLRAILARYLNASPQAIEFTYDPLGKPRLLTCESASTTHVATNPTSQSAIRNPQSAIEFNLAHSGELALVAVANNCAIGVDIERLRPLKHMAELAQRYFHPDEIRDVMSHDAIARGEAFFRCWTRKEAVLKAIGTGVQYPLDKFCVSLSNTTAEWVDVPARRSLAETRIWLAPIEPATDYVAAVACSDERPNVVGFILASS